ncbi:hypothetical protein [Pseudonocardia humida]|uniref:Roadblock/LAMTOR2 domain-containing protein n=1 Tax=Pseudonocardia humida TaxID=2800819 RepID=A0ABT0ZRY7_9PSEU|nr:hypothetical protein [Pseudonocardia humida]MCO1653481.1 hypothetical protein [Pseudonocardia humida]
MRADGLAAVLGPLLNDPRVLGAVLVDVDSGMVLDACAARAGGEQPVGPAGAGIGGVDPEVVGAGHAELGRVAFGLPGRTGPEPSGDELVVSFGPTRHHLLRSVPDPHGDRLVLSVVVDGSRRFAERVRRKLRGVPTDALTAGPTVVRRPGTGGWAAPLLGGTPAAVRRSGAREPAVPPIAGVRPDRAAFRGPTPARSAPPPGGLFDPPPPGPVAPAGPGGRTPTPLPFAAPVVGPPAVPGRVPAHRGTRPFGAPDAVPTEHAPVPAGVATPAVPAAHSAPSLFTPGADLRTAAPERPRSGSTPGERRAPDDLLPGDPRPPAPPSALPPGRSG